MLIVRCDTCQAEPRGVRDDAGTEAPTDPPMTWSRKVDRGTVRWMCEACSRAHVRGIEGRLDQEWW